MEIRMWPNKVADGNTRTTTPGILSDSKELDLDEYNSGTSFGISDDQNNGTNANHQLYPIQTTSIDEFPILDELDRLAKMSKFHYDGHMIKQDWLDRLTLKEIQNANKKEKFNSKFFFMTIEFAIIKCEDVKYKVLYYEENAERIIQTIPTNELFVVNDPELELDNIIELKNRKLEHSKQMGLLDMNLKPDTDSKNLLHKIVNYPVTRPLKREEQALLWKYRYYLTQNKKALTKFLQCFDLNLEFEGNMLMELMLKWQPMDVEDALELLGSKYKNYPKIRSYAISRLRLASNEDLILYLLQLVQALRYENFNLPNNQQNLPTIQSITTSNGSSLTASSNGSSKTASTTTSATKIHNSSSLKKSSSNKNHKNLIKSNSEILDKNSKSHSSSSSSLNMKTGDDEDTTKNQDEEDNDDQFDNFKYSSSPPLAAATTILGNRAHLFHQSESLSKKTFDSNLKTFLLQRANQHEIVALYLYWFVKVEIKDTKILTSSNSNATIANNSTATTAPPSSNSNQNLANAAATTTAAANEPYSANVTSNNANNNQVGANMQIDPNSKTNFQIFMDELLESLRNGDSYAKSIYENIINQDKFLKSLNDVVKATGRESGGRDKKVIKLRSFLMDTSKSSSNFDLVDFDLPIPLIIDPSVKIIGINVDKTTMFKSNLMPCKFVFKTLPDLNLIDENKALEYSVIYKIGDDLRQDQLVLQMIALMDKLLKQENLDLKLTPYKVVATGIKEGFLQFIDALPISNILANAEFRTIKEYLRKNNPSETDKHGISAEAMDNYVRSCAGYMVITYILGVGDRHYDNILITKCGKILHIDFGYILGRDPKPFQPIIKWTKDMADGMGGRFAPDGKENKEYEDFKKYCCNAFLHLRRHANLILNLFSLMVDANIPDIALEPDKTVKKLIERFKLEVADEQAQYLLIKEIESNYDSIVGNITDIFHTYSTAQK